MRIGPPPRKGHILTAEILAAIYDAIRKVGSIRVGPGLECRHTNSGYTISLTKQKEERRGGGDGGFWALVVGALPKADGFRWDYSLMKAQMDATGRFVPTGAQADNLTASNLCEVPAIDFRYEPLRGGTVVRCWSTQYIDSAKVSHTLYWFSQSQNADCAAPVTIGNTKILGYSTTPGNPNRDTWDIRTDKGKACSVPVGIVFYNPSTGTLAHHIRYITFDETGRLVAAGDEGELPAGIITTASDCPTATP